MKIIDLLNKIANGEEVPKKIKYDYNEWEYDEKAKTYYCGTCTLLNKYKYIYLNDEVGIIKEEKKIPEKLKSLNNVGNVSNLVELADKQHLNNHILKDKINEIIDYLQSKGDE